jgi:hypothetical protein
MLSKIADFYDEEADAAVSNLFAARPIMIVFLASWSAACRGHVPPDLRMINAVQ